MKIDYTLHFFIAAKAAFDAGQAIMKIYATDFTVETKADDSPLTKADMTANSIISKALKKTSYPVLSEEGKKISYEERSKWEAFWLVDPLDGTREFVKRNGEFTVNIALIHEQKPVMGIIYAPVPDIMYFGALHNGAFLLENVKELELSNFGFDHLAGLSKKLPVKQKRDRFVVVASRSHMSDETKRFIESLDKEKIETISRGSSLKLCMIAEGSADIYPRFAPTMEWDTAAGNAIILSAGGKVTHQNKQDQLLYNKESLLNPWFIAFNG